MQVEFVDKSRIIKSFCNGQHSSLGINICCKCPAEYIKIVERQGFSYWLPQGNKFSY